MVRTSISLMGYISKGWDDPGFEVGDLLVVPGSQLEAVKNHAQTLMKYCATRGVTLTAERRDDGSMEFPKCLVICPAWNPTWL